MSSLNASKNRIINPKKIRPINLTSINSPCDFLFTNKINQIAFSYLSVGQKFQEIKKNSNLFSNSKNTLYTITNPKIKENSLNSEHFNILRSNKTSNNMKHKKIKVTKKNNSLVTNYIFKEIKSKCIKKYVSPNNQNAKNRNYSYKSFNKIPTLSFSHKNKIINYNNKENKGKIKNFVSNFFDNKKKLSLLFLNNNKTITNRNDKSIKRNTEPNQLKSNDLIFSSKITNKKDLINGHSISNSTIECKNNVKDALKFKKIKTEDLTNLIGFQNIFKKNDKVNKRNEKMNPLNKSKERRKISKIGKSIYKKYQLKNNSSSMSKSIKENNRNKKLSFVSNPLEHKSQICKRNIRINRQYLFQEMKKQNNKHKNSIKTDENSKLNNIFFPFNLNSNQIFNKIKNNKNYCNDKIYKNQTDIDLNSKCVEENKKITKKILSIDFNKFIKVNLAHNKINKMKSIKKCLFNENQNKKVKIKREINDEKNFFFYKDSTKIIENVLFDENNLEIINDIDDKFDDIYAIVKKIDFHKENLNDKSIFNDADSYKKYKSNFDKFFDKNYNKKNIEFVFHTNTKKSKKKEKDRINNYSNSTKGGSSYTKGFRGSLNNRI